MFKFVFLTLFTFSVHASWQQEIINKAHLVYNPISEQKFNKPLLINVSENPSIAASADHGYHVLKVDIYSGALSTPRLTPDSLRMLICHELGHLFGGSPNRNLPYEWDGPVGDDGMSLMSAEGQADYFAGSECFQKITESSVTPERIEKAGLSFLNLVMDFPISIDTPDLTVTPVLIRDSYPGRQCRLDTIVRAARNQSRPACWFR